MEIKKNIIVQERVDFVNFVVDTCTVDSRYVPALFDFAWRAGVVKFFAPEAWEHLGGQDDICDFVYSRDGLEIVEDADIAEVTAGLYEACQEEIKLIYTLIHPKYAVPVHGEYKHLKAQAKIAESLGISKDNIFILSSGDVLEVSEEQAKVAGRVPVGAILVDGLGVGDVGNVVLRDRQHLAEDGIMIVVMSLDRASGELVAGPDIVSRGFVYVKESDELIEEARRTVDDALQACLDKGITDWGKLKTTTKDVLSDYVWKKTKRRPMILPIIMEV